MILIKAGEVREGYPSAKLGGLGELCKLRQARGSGAERQPPVLFYCIMR